MGKRKMNREIYFWLEETWNLLDYLVNKKVLNYEQFRAAQAELFRLQGDTKKQFDQPWSI